jgi:hypothetical protein
MDSSLCSREQTSEYGMETSKITSHEEVKNSTIRGKCDVDTFWDAQGPILEHCPERGTRVNRVCFSEMSCSKQTPRAIIKKMSECHMIMSICTLPPTPLKAFTN